MLGSSVKLVNAGLFGGVSDSNTYDSFGNRTNTSFSSRYQYTGREWDTTTSLQYSRARWYDPQIGRFISEDPIGFRGGDVNLYGYVLNNSVNFIDPEGLWTPADLADWLDDLIENARRAWRGNVNEWKRNGSVDTVADLSRMTVDPLRVGSGLGCAIYSEDEKVYGRAAFIAMDITRASTIFAALAGPIAEVAATGREFTIGNNGARIAPFGNRTGHPVGEWPHYHRRVPDPRRPGHSMPGQGLKQHRPWEGGW
jgi:RHS repeat-associated protein